jgi:stage V sporulation protein G
MQISEVRIKLMPEFGRLVAFASMTIDDCFVIRDMKVIHGEKGLFVAMPDRKITDRCPRCDSKNALEHRFCCQRGTRLGRRISNGERRSLYADIAHPINTECRQMIQQVVVAAYRAEYDLAQKPGYVCRYEVYGRNDAGESTAFPLPTMNTGS